MWVGSLGRKENHNYEISYIGRTSQDPGVYKQIQNPLLHIRVCGAQGDLSWTIHVDVQGWSAWMHYEGELLETNFFETVRISDFPSPVRSVGRTANVTKKPSKINKIKLYIWKYDTLLKNHKILFHFLFVKCFFMWCPCLLTLHDNLLLFKHIYCLYSYNFTNMHKLVGNSIVQFSQDRV